MPGRSIDREKAKAEILIALRGGNTRKASHEAAGIDQATFYRWLAADEKLESDVKIAEATAEQGHVRRIVAAADNGSWQASAWWLERRRYAEWKRQDGIDFGKLTVSQLLALAAAGGGGVESPGDRAASAEADIHEVSG